MEHHVSCIVDGTALAPLAHPLLAALSDPAARGCAQLRTGSHWLPEETGRWFGQSREERVCQQCKCGAIDDAAHMVFHCAEFTAQRRRYPQLFMAARGDLRAFYQQSPISVAAFVRECHDACDTTLSSRRDR